VLRSNLRFDVSTGWLGPATNGFDLRLTGLSGHGPIVLYSSSDFMDWHPFATSPPIVGSLTVRDTTAAKTPMRFYRAIEQ
jgi:hypothetical protein